MEVMTMDWLMTDDQKDAWETVRRINAAWLEGHPERLTELLHDRVVIVGPDGMRYGEGKEAVVESYRSFSQQATISDYRESDGKIDVYNTVAVVSYRFDIDYTIEGKSSRENGRDLFVLEKQDGRWLAVWRMVTAQGE
jgi:ketosteroid isomerase-like protein